MLQELIKAYADAYTVAVTPTIAHRHEDRPRNESIAEVPANTVRGRGWRVLVSAFF